MSDWWGRIWVSSQIAEAVLDHSEPTTYATEFVEVRFLREVMKERNELQTQVRTTFGFLNDPKIPNGRARTIARGRLRAALSPEQGKPLPARDPMDEKREADREATLEAAEEDLRRLEQ